jgi:hypothetical protein
MKNSGEIGLRKPPARKSAPGVFCFWRFQKPPFLWWSLGAEALGKKREDRPQGDPNGCCPFGTASEAKMSANLPENKLRISRGKIVTRYTRQLFFKALKQTLKIKTFVGTSANAVRTQVWTALIAMLVLKYLQLKSTFSWSLSTLAALLRQQLFFYRDLWAWLDDPFQAPPALAGVHDDAQQLGITW